MLFSVVHAIRHKEKPPLAIKALWRFFAACLWSDRLPRNAETPRS
jgi:hypothetical protein